MGAGTLAGGLLVACVTPFDRDEAVDTDAFRSIAEHLIVHGVDGLLVAGTTGEAHALSCDDRAELWRAAVEHADGRVPIVAGAGATTTREAKRFLALAAECGCDAALVLTPWFESPSAKALEAYYTELADAAEIPLLLYSNPSRTHVDWPAEAIASVAHQLAGRVIGYKDGACSHEHATALRPLLPDGFLLFSGGVYDRAEFRGLTDGVVDVLANALAPECVEAWHGDVGKIACLAPIGERLSQSANPIALLKAMMRKVGLPAGVPRRPFHLVPDEEVEAMKPLLAADGRLSAGSADEYGRPSTSGEVVHLLADRLVERCIGAEPPPLETAAVCPAERGGYQYACHASITHFDGRFFAAWSQGIINEDSPGQVVRCATSGDGRSWSGPAFVMPPPEGTLRWTNGGFWLRGDELWALAVRYTRARYVEGEKIPGHCWEDGATEAFRWTGSGWEPKGLLVDDVYVNEAPRRLPNGRWLLPGVNGRHDAVMALSADGADWQIATLSPRTDRDRLTEPSWFLKTDGTARCLLRDDAGSKRLFLTESRDHGDTWTEPRPTDFTDAQAKFFVTRLRDGRVAICGNPVPDETGRRLLAVATGDDERFTSLVRLQYEPDAAPRLPGMHKDAGFSYPNAVEVGGRLYVIYARNKEDIEVTSVRLSDL